MPTSDSTTARAALGALDAVGVTWAFLHGAEQLASGSISDLDLCIDPIDRAKADRLLRELLSDGLEPIVVWNYDITGTSYFLATSDLSHGVQLDLLCDPHGFGKYGLRTSVALEGRRLTSGVFELDNRDSWLYQVRKRVLKRQYDRLSALMANPPAASAELRSRANSLFAPDAAQLIGAALAGTTIPRQVVPKGSLARWGRRLTDPAAAWCHFSGEEADKAAIEVDKRLALLMPNHRRVRVRPASPSRVGVGPGLAPLRAGTIVSTGASPRRATATLLVDTFSDDTLEEVTRALAVRGRERALRSLVDTRS